mgnify:CR=1 FL=1
MKFTKSLLKKAKTIRAEKFMGGYSVVGTLEVRSSDYRFKKDGDSEAWSYGAIASIDITETGFTIPTLNGSVIEYKLLDDLSFINTDKVTPSALVGLKRATCKLALKDGFESVDGHMFDADGIELFIHRPLKKDRTPSNVGWSVTCPVLGMKIYDGEKRAELIESTRSKINSPVNLIDKDTLKEVIIKARKRAGK